MTELKKAPSLRESARLNGVYDHKERLFPTIRDMCDHYGINVCTFRSRLLYGWSVEAALLTPPGDYSKRQTCDHLGVSYPSLAEMCRHYRIDPDTYRARIKGGHMSQEEALTTPVIQGGHGAPKHCTDHLGNAFPSIKEMCRHYLIDEDVYGRRKKLGWTLEKILTTSTHPVPVIDPVGRKYPSMRAMCRAYNISPNTVASRIKEQGLSLEEALTRPVE